MRLQTRLEAFYAFRADAASLLLRPASALQKALAQRALERYEGGEVLEYLLGCAEFAGRYFACDSSTLVPREDSLALLDLCAGVLGGLYQPAWGDTCGGAKPLKVLEIGVGTGVLSICLLLCAQNRLQKGYLQNSCEGAKFALSACDISAGALKIAAQNAASARVNLELLHADFADLNFAEFDFIFSNPPYIAADFPLDERVRKEPASALFGGQTGAEILINIINKTAASPARALACEIGYDQKDLIAAKLDAAGFSRVFWQQDLAGIYRAFLALK